MKAANLPVTLTLTINGQPQSFTGTADKVIVNATNAFENSNEGKAMDVNKIGLFEVNKITNVAINQMDANIKNYENSPTRETDAVTQTNSKLGSSSKYSNGSTPITFNGNALINDHN